MNTYSVEKRNGGPDDEALISKHAVPQKQYRDL
jgi:hypothetical protein